MKRTAQLMVLVMAMVFSSLALAARPRPKPAPVVMKYILTVYNATGAWGDPAAAATLGLGTQVFDGPVHMVQFTGYAHQSQIKNYSVIAADGRRVDGQTVALTSASVEIFDSNYNLIVHADFLPGEVYVGSDLTNAGIGFGSKIYPIYPYSLLSNNVPMPQYTLDKDYILPGQAFSCVGYAAGPCKNASDGSTRFLLKTNKGDFWIGTEGIAPGSFVSQRQY